jgi:SAM-dependent methyltransferase
VFAVEPLAEMRAVLAETVPGVEVLAGAAEALPLESASVDAVTVGQAFHWFDPVAAVTEAARVLRPNGVLALVWNIRDLDDPLQRELQQLIAPYRGGAPSEHEQPWQAVFADHAAFAPGELSSFRWVQRSSAAQLVERFASVSFIAALDERERGALLERLRGLVAGLAEPFAFRYRTDVFVYRRVADPVSTVPGN